MKRDMDLVRKILLKIEDVFDYAPVSSSNIKIDGYANEQIGYHLAILADGGLIDIIDANSHDSRMFSCFIHGITWYGHDFLDSVRNDGVWSQTKEKLKPVGSISFEVIKSVAVECAKNMMGLP